MVDQKKAGSEWHDWITTHVLDSFLEFGLWKSKTKQKTKQVKHKPFPLQILPIWDNISLLYCYNAEIISNQYK